MGSNESHDEPLLTGMNRPLVYMFPQQSSYPHQQHMLIQWQGFLLGYPTLHSYMRLMTCIYSNLWKFLSNCVEYGSSMGLKRFWWELTDPRKRRYRLWISSPLVCSSSFGVGRLVLPNLSLSGVGVRARGGRGVLSCVHGAKNWWLIKITQSCNFEKLHDYFAKQVVLHKCVNGLFLV